MIMDWYINIWNERAESSERLLKLFEEMGAIREPKTISFESSKQRIGESKHEWRQRLEKYKTHV